MTYRKPAHRPLLASVKDALTDMRLSRPLGRLTAAGLGAMAPLAALASPTGGQVVAGSATISNPVAGGTLVNQSSQRAVINWQQFSVGANQYVQFVQPDSSAIVLNRVIGGNISSIFGDIKANGQVFLINPNGILFGKGATLDVSGLVASTQSLSDSNFMAGRYSFIRSPGAPDASVINQGAINAKSGGYVVLAGDYVENDGQISAETGRVYLSAGGGATLTMNKSGLISYNVNGATLARLAGVDNTGQITAQGGAVVMTADVANALTATAVNNSGLITAQSIRNHNGEIVLAAAGGDIANSGTLDVSASGFVQGGDIIIRSDKHTLLAKTSVIDAAGGDGAKGGFVDLSGHNLAVRGTVGMGKGGTLLLDPTSIDIGSGASSLSNGGQSTNPNHVSINFIAHQLNTGNNVEIVASNNITYTGAGGQTLTALGSLAAGKSLTIETGVITGCGIGGVCAGTGVLPFVSSLNFGNINLTGLTLNIKGSVNIQTGGGNVTVDGITAQSGIFMGGGRITINGNLAAGSGSLNVNSNPISPGGFIHANGKTLSGGRVNLNVGAASYGGTISIGAINATIHAGVTVGQSVGNSNDTIKVGSITAPDISIGITGFHDLINVGPITAVNAAGTASVHITEVVHNGGTGAINVNGNITVSGKPGSSVLGHNQFDLPLAAGLFINAGGSGAADVYSVKVNGAIDVTAHGGGYHAGSCECGIPKRLQSGTGGLAAAFITVGGSHGAASVAGAITAKGPDALVGVQAHAVQVHNVSVTGSGHHVNRRVNPTSTAGSYTSSNSAGQANLILGQVPATSSYGGPGISATVKAGTISVSGKGVADAGLFASNVSAGNITVTATAASGKITKDSGKVTSSCTGFCANQNSSDFYDNFSRVPLHLGSIHMGGANIEIGANNAGRGSSAQQAANIKVGALSATGVGLGRISLSGKAVNTQGLTAVATKGSEKGTGSSQSGVTAATTFVHTFDINGGGAEIKIRSGNSGSHSSGVLTQNGGPVTISGNVSATGPAASVDVKGKSIKVAGTLTVTGSGGSITSDTVVTPPAGGGYHTHFVGNEPTSINLQGAASGSVSVAGKTNIKAPGIIGVIMVGGGVKLNGFSGSASAAVNYSILDTRVSPTAQNFTAASFGLVVAGVKAVGGKPAFGSASDTGDMTVKSKGNVNLPDMLKISGNLNVQAVGNIVGSSNGLIGQFNAIDAARPRAGSHSGGGPGSGVVLPKLTASAKAISMVAGKNIDVSGGQLTIGNGSTASVHGDSIMLAGLAAANLSPNSPNPNGDFIAGGAVTLGGITLTGSYLLLQGTVVSVLGKVSVPTGAVIQVSPFDPTTAMDIEDSLLLKEILAQGVTTNAVSSNFGVTNVGFLSLFPGATIVVGNAAETGNATLGANGPIDIGSTNLIIDTQGTITGLGTVTSTGLVSSLLSLLGPPIPPVTAGEIDPGAGSDTSTGLGDETDKKHLGQPGGLGGGGQQGGTISHDDSGTGVCH